MHPATTSQGELMDSIAAIESALGKKSTKEVLPLQRGHVPNTSANSDDLVEQFHYRDSTTFKDCIQWCADWSFKIYGEGYHGEKIAQ